MSKKPIMVDADVVVKKFADDHYELQIYLDGSKTPYKAVRFDNEKQAIAAHRGFMREIMGVPGVRERTDDDSDTA